MPRLAAALVVLSATAAQAEVLIGVAGPLSGQYQSFGQAMVNGVKAGTDKINADGGLQNELLRVITVDDQCDTIKAREAAEKLTAAKVDVVIGHFCSNQALEAAKIYARAGLTMIAPTAALPALTETGLNNVIRITTRIDAQGAFAARRVLAKRPNAKLALIDDGSAEMKSLVASFATAHGKVPALTATITPDQKDFSALIAKLEASAIDTAYIAAQPADAGRLTAAIGQAKLDLKRYGPDALLADSFWSSSGAAGENTLVSFPIDPENNNDAKALSKDLKVLGQSTDGAFFPAYAATQLFAAASATQGPHAGTKIASALKSGEPNNTVLGPFSFDAKGDGLELRFNWYSWNNGVYQTIAPENP